MIYVLYFIHTQDFLLERLSFYFEWLKTRLVPAALYFIKSTKTNLKIKLCRCLLKWLHRGLMSKQKSTRCCFYSFFNQKKKTICFVYLFIIENKLLPWLKADIIVVGVNTAPLSSTVVHLWRQQRSQRVRLQEGSGSAGVHRRGGRLLLLIADQSEVWRQFKVNSWVFCVCVTGGRRGHRRPEMWDLRQSAEERRVRSVPPGCCETCYRSVVVVVWLWRSAPSQLVLGRRERRPSGSRQGQHLRQDPPQAHTGRWEAFTNLR